MDRILALKKKRAEAVDAMEALVTNAKDGMLSEDDAASFEELEKEAGVLAKDIERLERLEALKAQNAVPMTSQTSQHTAGAHIESGEPKLEKGVVFSQIVRSMAAGKGIQSVAREHAKQVFGENHPTTKALGASSGDSGGYLVPQEYSREMIELLRNKTVVRKAGAHVIPMPKGNMSIPKQTMGATAGYSGENRDIKMSEPEFGNLNLNSRKLTALVPISNDLMRVADPAVDGIVINDITVAMALTEDLYFLTGNGTEFSPKGIYHWMHKDNRFDSAGADISAITKDARRAVGGLVNHNVGMITPGWIMAPQTRLFLEDLRGANDNLIFPEVSAKNQFKGYPIHPTTAVPINLGENGNETKMYLVDFNDVLIAEEFGIELSISTEAAYRDANGHLVSAFSQDQTVIRVIAKHDLGMRYSRSAACVEKITWGSA